MATTTETSLYDFDPHMSNPKNKVPSERQTLQTPGRDDYFFIIPKAAPFFAKSMKLVNETTGKPLTEGVDFVLGHYFVEAMQRIDQPICGSIRFLNHAMAGIVRMEYHTIGGDWGFDSQAILAELSNKHLNPLRRSWGMIKELPYSFPVVPHDQSVDSLVGSEELEAAIESIAKQLEASAAGSTENHLKDFNNPHRVNKAQVGLPDVPNWAVASEAAAKAGTAQTGFMNPYLTALAIAEQALKPLNTFMERRDNPNVVTAAQIGLNLVANFPPASREEAVDPTINNRVLTPYTAALLVASMSDSAQFAAILKLIEDHINDEDNPHKVTPAKIGTYTSEQIDQLLSTVSASDTPRFDGLTGEEWRLTLPSFDDVTAIIEELGNNFNSANVRQIAVVVDDPLTPEDKQALENTKFSSAVAMHNAYYVYAPDRRARVIKDNSVIGLPDTFVEGFDKMVSLPDATYWLDAQGAINATGSAALVIPAAYKSGTGFLPANAMTSVFANKTAVYASNDAGKLVRIAGGVATVLQASGAFGVITNNEFYTRGEMVFQEMTDGSYIPYGDSAWVSAANNLLASFNADIAEVAIGDDRLLFLFDDGTVRVYRITRGTNLVTLTLLDNPVGTPNNPSSITGNYRHYSIMNDAGEYVLFGDNSEGQLNVNPRLAPFTAVACGYNYTVTVDRDHRVMFWGDSPDNSLLYRAA